MTTRSDHRRLRRCDVWALGLLVVWTAGCVAPPAQATDYLAAHGLRYWLTVRAKPRPLRLHHLRVDLANPGIEIESAPAPDPDGAGPATAALEPPAAIANRTDAVALVNANPWEAIPDAAGRRNTNWREGQPVRALGLVVSHGRAVSGPAAGHCAFWLDRERRPHVGVPTDLADIREGVAGFGQLLRAGQVLPDPGGPIHPRTALGIDRGGRWLTLVVVDGRQAGYSEGMTLREIADYMQELGCADAVNLDGGGSSILILAGDGRTRRVMNDPSTKRDGVSVPRPIPVALVIRAVENPP